MENTLNYCDACLVGTSLPSCPQCGRKKLRKALLSDWCFLLKKEALWSEPLKDFLKDNGIFFITQPCTSGLSAYGILRDDAEKFFVRAIDLERATELCRDFLSEDVTFLEEDGSIWEPDDEIIIE